VGAYHTFVIETSAHEPRRLFTTCYGFITLSFITPSVRFVAIVADQCVVGRYPLLMPTTLFGAGVSLSPRRQKYEGQTVPRDMTRYDKRANMREERHKSYEGEERYVIVVYERCHYHQLSSLSPLSSLRSFVGWPVTPYTGRPRTPAE